MYYSLSSVTLLYLSDLHIPNLIYILNLIRKQKTFEIHYVKKICMIDIIKIIIIYFESFWI